MNFSEKKVFESETASRKLEHLQICVGYNIEAIKKTTWLEDVLFLHQALPEVSFDEIETETTFLGYKFSFPLVITGITGGHPYSKKINARIGEIIQEVGVGAGVGSQRAALEKNGDIESFKVIRREAPDSFIMANIGITQFLNGFGSKELEEIINMVEADALAIHLNPLQEILQMKGSLNFKYALKKIEEVCSYSPVPVIIKETGAGITKELAEKLLKAGVSAIDISGAGGTSWSAVEKVRATLHGEREKEQLGSLLWDWGIPTAATLLEVKSAVKDKIEIIGSGGIRTGLEIAKVLAIGSDLAGTALPVLRWIYNLKREEVIKKMEQLKNELKAVMFLTGSKSIKELKETEVIIKDKLAKWIQARNLTLKRNIKLM